MELSPKMSKVLKASLLVLGAILLLLIGSAFGSHFGRNDGFGRYNRGCFGSDNSKFERGDQFEGRNGGRRFRMMAPQAVDSAKVLAATSTQAVSSTPNSVPAIK